MKVTGFESLHQHSYFSILDGYGSVDEYAKRCVKNNQKFLCISDHGMMAAIPSQIRSAKEHNLQPIFAIELYVNNDHPEDPKIFAELSKEERKKIRKSYHLLGIARNETGLKNLINLSSWGWANGFYHKPRVTHKQLKLNKEGIIFTSCCYNSEIGQAFDKFGNDGGFSEIEKYISMFGKENFYLEIMLLDFDKQKPYDKFILLAAEKYKLPTIVTLDAHYANEEDSKYQRYMLMIQRGTTLQEINDKISSSEEEKVEIFEMQDKNLWLKSEDELNQKWIEDYQEIIPLEFFEECKSNTVKVSNMCKGVKIDCSPKLPKIPNPEDKLIEEIAKGMKYRNIPINNKKYYLRVQEEFNLIKRKEFCTYFLIQKIIIDEAKKKAPDFLNFADSQLSIGPGRGCLLPNSQIYIEKDKTVTIKDLKLTDHVCNLDGEFVGIERKFTYSVTREPVIRLTTDNGDLWLTSDHLVYSDGGDRSEMNWFRADKIRKEMLLFNSVTKSLIEVKASIFDFYTGEVYDIEVSGEQRNYCTLHGVVHNSAVGSLVCYLLGITDVDPIRHDLLFSRFLSESRGGKSMKLDYSKESLIS